MNIGKMTHFLPQKVWNLLVCKRPTRYIQVLKNLIFGEKPCFFGPKS